MQIQLRQCRVDKSGRLRLNTNFETIVLENVAHNLRALFGFVAMPSAPDDQCFFHMVSCVLLR